MPHPRELINKIRSLLEIDYPSSGHTYVVEKYVAGTRFSPDIQILDKTKKLVCVVEIGYTRPEKLVFYREELGIKDTRWYDKNGNLCPLYVKPRDSQIIVDPTWECSVYIKCDYNSICKGCGYTYEDDNEEPSIEVYVITDHNFRASLIYVCLWCSEVWSDDDWFYGLDVLGPNRHLERCYGVKRSYGGTWQQCSDYVRDMVADSLPELAYPNATVVKDSPYAP